MSALVSAPSKGYDLPILGPRVVAVDGVVNPFPGFESGVRIVFHAGDDEDETPWLLFTPFSPSQVTETIARARNKGSLLVIWVGLQASGVSCRVTGKPVLIGRVSYM